MVASTSLPPGAEMMTFLAPPFRWAEAFSLVVKKPVHSSTTSTPSSPHGISAGLRCANTRILSPLTIMLSPSTVDGARELAVRGVVAGQVGVRLGVAEVVDRHDLDVLLLAAFVESAQDIAADAAITVDCNFDRHCFYS
jgi:hypothetical protein